MIIWRGTGKLFHAAQLALRFLAHLIGKIGLFQTLAQIVGVCLLAAFLAQFLLNGLHLLAQHVITLRLIHF